MYCETPLAVADPAAVLADFSEDVLRRARLRPGMQVLDVGCGSGDLSLLVAKMVGSSGSVLGVDRVASSVKTARQRAGALGVRNVRFEEADLAAFTVRRQFDAIVGRCVLLYMADRAAILRRLIQCLRPGGIVMLLEPDLAQISQVPASDVFTKARRWTLEALAAIGTELQMGASLHRTFLQAGLPVPNMLTHQIVCGATSPGWEHMAEALRSLLPVIERNGIANSAEIDIDTLGERLRADAVANHRVLFLSRFVGAWTRTPLALVGG